MVAPAYWRPLGGGPTPTAATTAATYEAVGVADHGAASADTSNVCAPSYASVAGDAAVGDGVRAGDASISLVAMNIRGLAGKAAGLVHAVSSGRLCDDVVAVVETWLHLGE